MTSLALDVVRVRKHEVDALHAAEPSGMMPPAIAPLIIGGIPRAIPKDMRKPTMIMAMPAIL